MRRAVVHVVLLLLFGASPVAAQWRFAAPAAATSWFAVLDSLRLTGQGALPLTRTTGAPSTPLGRTLTESKYDILHFVPLYYPSASQGALADAVEDAAGTAAPRADRAQFVVGALRRALPDPRDRRPLVELAAAVRRAQPAGVAPAQLAAWQEAWNRRFNVGLARFLAAERLDAGLVLVAPALGAEGRVFSGVPADRADNIIAIGTGAGPNDPDAPLFAAVRELCFPLVSRVADATPQFRRAARNAQDAARRSSIAAVRCGADLMDLLLPAEAASYRAHWRAVAVASASSFDTLYPPDALLDKPIGAALRRSLSLP